MIEGIPLWDKKLLVPSVENNIYPFLYKSFIASKRSNLDSIGPPDINIFFLGTVYPTESIDFKSASSKVSPKHPTSPVEAISTPKIGSASCKREKEN